MTHRPGVLARRFRSHASGSNVGVGDVEAVVLAEGSADGSGIGGPASEANRFQRLPTLSSNPLAVTSRLRSTNVPSQVSWWAKNQAVPISRTLIGRLNAAIGPESCTNRVIARSITPPSARP